MFAAGTSLLDTTDSSLMNFAYGWACSKPVRKVFYNRTITGPSAAVTLLIETIELAGLIAPRPHAHGGLERININALGLITGGMFLAV